MCIYSTALIERDLPLSPLDIETLDNPDSIIKKSLESSEKLRKTEHDLTVTVSVLS